MERTVCSRTEGQQFLFYSVHLDDNAWALVSDRG